jgi:hydrogenase/urease accessory protein HupE
MEEIPELTVDQSNADALQNSGTWASIIGVGIIVVGDVLIGADAVNLWDIEPVIYNAVVGVGAFTAMAGVGAFTAMAGVALTCAGLNTATSH